jgi:hypothetical protein
MAINSTNSNSVKNFSFSRQELGIIFSQAGTNTALSNYLANAASLNLSKNEILSAARYLTYVQNAGYTTYQSGGTYYAFQQFLSSGTFTPGPFLNSYANILVVAGGGGGDKGGAGFSGGGGAGGLIQQSNVLVNQSSYSITVGAGGTRAVNGNNSIFSSYTAIGGGAGGGSGGTNVGNNGGSGGGSSNYGPAGPNFAGGAETSGQGNAGGRSSTTSDGMPGGGGGSGGAGIQGVGGYASGQIGGGGPGLQINITGTNVVYAAGGNGGAHAPGNSTTVTQAGLGATSSFTNGANNSGSGGGGGQISGSAGGSGGSGVVIIRFSFTIPASFGA